MEEPADEADGGVQRDETVPPETPAISNEHTHKNNEAVVSTRPGDKLWGKDVTAITNGIGMLCSDQELNDRIEELSNMAPEVDPPDEEVEQVESSGEEGGPGYRPYAWMPPTKLSTRIEELTAKLFDPQLLVTLIYPLCKQNSACKVGLGGCSRRRPCSWRPAENPVVTSANDQWYM